MRACAKCGTETSNPTFCSNSCRASVTNRGVRRHGEDPGVCRQCSAPLGRARHSFCSLECHRESENERHVRRWLATGVPGQQALAGSVREFLMMEQGGVCAICGRDPVWNGATLVFVLDHIDGDGGNHVRDNGRHYRRERYRAGLSY